jgi:hypothetical protein
MRTTLGPVVEELGIQIIISESQVLSNPGAPLLDYDEVFDYATQYFDGHYFLNDHPMGINSWPFGAVLDLETMEVLAKGNSDLTADIILDLAEQVQED